MLQSEELKRDIVIDPSSKYAIDVRGDFQFPDSEPPDLGVPKNTAGGFGGGGMSDKIKEMDKKKKEKKEKKEAENRAKKGLPPIVTEEKKPREPFALRDIDLQIPRGEQPLSVSSKAHTVLGALVCIVGRVATGKTSILSGLINEMQQLKGHVSFGGPVSYGE